VVSDHRVGSGLRFIVDLTGNGAADLIRLAPNEVLVWYNNGRGAFGPVQGVCVGEGDAWRYGSPVLLMANM
jgi:hypothetical protein